MYTQILGLSYNRCEKISSTIYNVVVTNMREFSFLCVDCEFLIVVVMGIERELFYSCLSSKNSLFLYCACLVLDILY